MSAVADPRGLKRICLSCGTRFYDFNKRPALCPSCKVEFKAEVKAKGRRSRAAANDEKIAAIAAKPVETEEIEAEEDTVSLEEVEDMDDADEGDDLESDADIALGDDIDEDLDTLEDDLDEDLDEEDLEEEDKE